MRGKKQEEQGGTSDYKSKQGRGQGKGRAKGGAAATRQTRGRGRGQTSLPETMGHFPFGGQEGACQGPGGLAEGAEREWKSPEALGLCREPSLGQHAQLLGKHKATHTKQQVVLPTL